MIYEITWVDSNQMEIPWGTPGEVEAFAEKPLTVTTVCYVLQVMPDRVIIFMSKPDTCDQIGGVLAIPRQAVISARKLV